MGTIGIVLGVVFGILSRPVVAGALEESAPAIADFAQEQQIGELERTVGRLEHRVDRLEDQFEKLDRDLKELKRKM